MHIVMNKKLASMLATASLLMLSAGAHAADGTVNFIGSLVSSTCSVAVGNAGTVTLPKVSASALGTKNARAGRASFAINLTGCSGVTGVRTGFTGANIDITTGHLKNTATDATQGVSLVFMSAKTGIDLPLGRDLSYLTPIVGGAATVTFLTEYYAEADGVGPGTLTSAVDYEFSYQ
jgi:major type 1 subunit fimbrin (pilin)